MTSQSLPDMLAADSELLGIKDDTGNSLLHIAAQNNHRRIAKLLLKLRSDVDGKNQKGNTPLHYCYAYGYSQLAEFLVTVGLKSSERCTLPLDARCFEVTAFEVTTPN